jgi:hypothetical protein
VTTILRRYGFISGQMSGHVTRADGRCPHSSDRASLDRLVAPIRLSRSGGVPPPFRKALVIANGLITSTIKAV